MRKSKSKSKSRATKSDFFSDYFSKLKLVLFSPNKHFDSVKKESGILPALKFILFTYFIAGILSAITILIILPDLGINVAIFEILGSILIGLISPFIGAAIYHIFVMLFKGKGKFYDTYKTSAYSGAPAIFSWIPYVGVFVSIIWGYIILTAGIMKLHSLSNMKAILVWLIPTLILLAMVWLVLLSTVGPVA